MADNKKKKKAQKFLRKVIADGKLSNKEAKKAQKKGIRLERIVNAFEKSQRSGNSMSGAAPSSRPRPFSTPIIGPSTVFTHRGVPIATERPAPALMIKPGAQRALDREVAAREAATAAASAPATTSATTSATTPPTTGGEDVVTVKDTGDESGMIGRPVTDPPVSQTPAFDPVAFQAANDKRFDDLMATIEAQNTANQQFLTDMAAQNAARMKEMDALFAQKEAKRQEDFRTSAFNMARGGLTPDFRIGADPRRSVFGTSGFKRRKRIRPMTIAQGIAPTTAATAAGGASTGNLLNV